MKRIEVIPAIDLIGGKCVRLSQGDYTRCTTYANDPLDMAKRFESAGLKRLHLVDLEGSQSGQVVNLKVLERLAGQTTLQLDFSGGIRTLSDAQNIFDAGARWICLGSLAQSDIPQTKEFLRKFGKERIIICADVWDENICIKGWKKVTSTTIYELIEAYGTDVKQLICTDISRDGMLAGPGIALYRRLRESYPKLEIIASGGVGCKEDIEQLNRIGLEGVIVGKAFYEKTKTFNIISK